MYVNHKSGYIFYCLEIGKVSPLESQNDLEIHFGVHVEDLSCDKHVSTDYTKL